MRAFIYVCVIGAVFSFSSCVQKTQKRLVRYVLTIPKTSVESVGIRGNDQPLSWDHDVKLQAIILDSVYESHVTYQTGYLFTEVKFTLNGKFEREGKPNRKIIFSSSDTTTVYARFDEE